MYNEENKVKTYACIPATNNSIRFIKSTMALDTNPTVTLWKIKARLIKLNNTMWPAVTATKRRTVSEKGFVKIPMISTGRITSRNGSGTPGVQKMCDQYALLPFTLVIMKVKTASVNVMEILPVKLPAPGSNPNKFPKRIKKNKVSM